MTLPQAYVDLLVRVTGLSADQLPEDPLDRLAAVQAAQLIYRQVPSTLCGSAFGRSPVRESRGRMPPDRVPVMADFLQSTRTLYGANPWRVALLAPRAKGTDLPAGKILAASLLAMAGKDNEKSTQRIGKYLQACVDRPLGGLVLRRDRDLSDHEGAWWCVELENGD